MRPTTRASTDEQRAAVERPHAAASARACPGKAVAERRVIAAGDYLAGEFQHDADGRCAGRTSGHRRPHRRPDHRRRRAARRDRGLPPRAARLRRHRRGGPRRARRPGGHRHHQRAAHRGARALAGDLARRAETERALRDITARIAALREPEVILDRVVEEAQRLLGTDGAHLTRMGEDGTYLVPVVVAGGDGRRDPRPGCSACDFPLGGGINGLAAEQGGPIWTSDYLADPRIPHEPRRRRRRRRGWACAAWRRRRSARPVARSSARSRSRRATPRSFEPEELDLLQGLADQAAIAITNSTLLTRLTPGGGALPRPRPDDAGRHLARGSGGPFTFMADGGEALFGWAPEEVIGLHFAVLTAEESLPMALENFARRSRDPDLVRARPRSCSSARRHDVPGRGHDGLGLRGRSVGRRPGHRPRRHRAGAASSASCASRRSATASSSRTRRTSSSRPTPRAASRSCPMPMERMTGCRPTRSSAMHFSNDGRRVVPRDRRDRLGGAHGRADAAGRRASTCSGTGRPARPRRGQRDRDGRCRWPVRRGVHGSTRDIGERERLERELRESEERYRFLVEYSPDLVCSTDAEGRFTFCPRRSRGRCSGSSRPSSSASLRDDRRTERHAATAGGRFRWLVAPIRAQVPPDATAVLRTRDGRRSPWSRSARSGIDGRRAVRRGIHGAARDVSERDRLERDLRRQAGELAAGEERAHLARELHDSVTQALFSMTLVSRSVELLLDRDPEAAGPSWPSCATSSARRWPRCAR